MGLLDRGIRRALRHLDDGEVVVASLTGIEADGRRRRFVVVTGHRVLVGSARGEEPVDHSLDEVDAHYDRRGGRLTLQTRESETVLRDVDELAVRALVEVVAQYRRPTPTTGPGSPGGVTIIDDLGEDSSVA